MGLEDVIVEIILICVFAILGIMYLSGKCSFLIPKYRCLSENMKKKTDVKKLSRLFGFASLFASLSLCVMVTGGLLKIQLLFFAGILMLGADAFFLFSRGSRSERFIIQEKSDSDISKENSSQK